MEGRVVRLTRGADYGLRGLLYLAKQPPGQVCLVGQVAEAEGIPQSYLAKIFQDLSRSGLMVSHRGAKGGFSLARSADSINLRQVIEAIQGPIAFAACLDPRQGCPRQDTCGLYRILAQAQATLLRTLESTTLQQLAEAEQQFQATHPRTPLRS